MLKIVLSLLLDWCAYRRAIGGYAGSQWGLVSTWPIHSNRGEVAGEAA
ncbi:MAG: hypothetical protein ABWZ80_06835 [Beijerinckiaceae bacterium]